MIAEFVKVKVIGQNFSCMYRVSNVYDRVCIEIHDSRYMIHDTRYMIHDTRRFRVSCTELCIGGMQNRIRSRA